MSTAELIEMVRGEWAAWDARIAPLDDALLLRPTNDAGWTIRDVIAHLTWFERETIELIRSREFGGSQLWMLPADERNAAIFELNSGRSLDDVRADAQATRVVLLAALATLDDAELDDPGRYPPMPTELTPLQIFEDNTWVHYEAHRERIEAWLAR
jgi:uncharacterized protein (TIGR03083 family)